MAQKADGSDERSSTAGPDQADFRMLEPLVVFLQMLTSEQLEKVETAAKTLSSAQGINQAKVVVALENISSGSCSVGKGQKNGRNLMLGRRLHTVAMGLATLFIGVRNAHSLRHLSLSEMRGCAKTSRRNVSNFQLYHDTGIAQKFGDVFRSLFVLPRSEKVFGVLPAGVGRLSENP